MAKRILIRVLCMLTTIGWAGLVQAQEGSAAEISFLSQAVCGDRATALNNVVLSDARDMQGFINRRQRLQTFIYHAEEQIMAFIELEDDLKARMTCAWVDDFTDGMSVACPWDQDPSYDLLTPTLVELCMSLRRAN
jgi:hypothetical protein